MHYQEEQGGFRRGGVRLVGGEGGLHGGVGPFLLPGGVGDALGDALGFLTVYPLSGLFARGEGGTHGNDAFSGKTQSVYLSSPGSIF